MFLSLKELESDEKLISIDEKKIYTMLYIINAIYKKEDMRIYLSTLTKLSPEIDMIDSIIILNNKTIKLIKLISFIKNKFIFPNELLQCKTYSEVKTFIINNIEKYEYFLNLSIEKEFLLILESTEIFKTQISPYRLKFFNEIKKNNPEEIKEKIITNFSNLIVTLSNKDTAYQKLSLNKINL